MEGDVVEEALEDRVEAARADVLVAGVDLLGDAGDLFDAVGREREIDGVGAAEQPGSIDIVDIGRIAGLLSQETGVPGLVAMVALGQCLRQI